MSTSQIDRRSLFRGLLAPAAVFGMDAMFTAERTDAAAVGPNDKIKVTKIETFVLKNSWVFVKISTDAGVTGWGEMLKDDAKACAAGALEVGHYLIGQDPNRVVFHWQAIHRGSFYRGGPIKTAISAGSIRRSGISRAKSMACRCTSCSAVPRATESASMARSVRRPE